MPVDYYHIALSELLVFLWEIFPEKLYQKLLGELMINRTWQSGAGKNYTMTLSSAYLISRAYE